MEVQIIAVIMKLLNHSVTPEVPIFLRFQYFFGFQAHNTTKYSHENFKFWYFSRESTSPYVVLGP